MRKHLERRGFAKMTAILGVKPITPIYRVGGWQKVELKPKVCKIKGCGRLFYGKGKFCGKCIKEMRENFKDLLEIAYA